MLNSGSIENIDVGIDILGGYTFLIPCQDYKVISFPLRLLCIIASVFSFEQLTRHDGAPAFDLALCPDTWWKNSLPSKKNTACALFHTWLKNIFVSVLANISAIPFW